MTVSTYLDKKYLWKPCVSRKELYEEAGVEGTESAEFAQHIRDNMRQTIDHKTPEHYSTRRAKSIILEWLERDN